MIETLLEYRPWGSLTALTGTVTTANGSTALTGAGTSFTTELEVGGVIRLVDDAGAIKFYTIASITDNTNAVLLEAATSVASGVSASTFPNAGQRSPFFKANNAVQKSSIIANQTIDQYILTDPLVNSQISVNEGVLIKSVYLRLPYQFPMGDTPIPLQFIYLDNTSGTQGFITALGVGGQFFIPNENIEVPINIYVPPLGNALTTNTWQIAVGFPTAAATLAVANTSDPNEAAISQIDGPGILNDNYLPIFAGIRILHGIALT